MKRKQPNRVRDGDAWAIAGKILGIDTETNHIADELARELINEHKADLI